MKEFTWFNPTRIHFGTGAIEKLGGELKQLGARQVLFVYGMGSIRANGVYDEITAQCANANVQVVEHGGVQGNPTLAHTRAGIDKAKKERVDVVCAVGGGSVIDEAKAIAAGAMASFDVWELFCGRQRPAAMLPLLAVSTLPATGSEMNGICVVTNEETSEKNALVAPGLLNPTASFLDPATTVTLSSAQTGFACTDILSHVMEAYFTTSAQRLPLQDNLMEGVCRATVEAMETILRNPGDLDARGAFMWSSTLAWNGLVQAGVPGASMPCHGLEMPLSAVYDVAHGAGLSVVIPAWMEVAGERHQKRIARFMQAVFQVNTDDISQMAHELKTFYRHIGSPVSMDEAGIGTADVDRLVALAASSFAQRGITDYPPARIEAIYLACQGA